MFIDFGQLQDQLFDVGVGTLTANGSGISAEGDVAASLAPTYQRGIGFDPGWQRPFQDSRGRPCVTINTGRKIKMKDAKGEVVLNKQNQALLVPERKTFFVEELRAKGYSVPTINAGTLLRKDEWINLDNAVLEAARKPMRAWADLRAASTYGGFDAMANPILEWERVTDMGEAVVDMDGMTETRNVDVQYDREGMPLPIAHAGFFLSERFLIESRQKGRPADTIRGEMAGRRIGELIEETTIGTRAGTTYGNATNYTSGVSKVYGYMTHPDRITKTNMTAPTGSNGTTVLTDWLACRELMYTNLFFGPFIVYVSSDYDQYLDNLFSTAEPSAGTLRERLMKIDSVKDIRRLDFLPGATYPFHSIWVSMTPDNVQAVNGLEVTTVQWPSMGGMRTNFMTYAIQWPRIRSKYIGQGLTASTKTGILIATTS